MDVVDALRLDPAAHVLVIGDDGHQLHRQVADGIAVEQIVEAVAELGDQDEHARLDAQRSCNCQSKSKPVATGRKPRLNRSAVIAAGAENDTRMKKRSVSGSPYWALSTMLQSCEAMRIGHRGDDAAPVAAGQRQDETRRFGGHGRSHPFGRNRLDGQSCSARDAALQPAVSCAGFLPRPRRRIGNRRAACYWRRAS